MNRNNNKAIQKEPIYDAIKAHKAQEEYCEKNELPHFAPTRYCWSCNRDIYEEYVRENGFTTGISVQQAGSSLITGCPHCHRSYCD